MKTLLQTMRYFSFKVLGFENLDLNKKGGEKGHRQIFDISIFKVS